MKRVVSSPRSILTLAVLFLTLTAGCNMLAGDNEELPAAETVENQTQSIETIQATVVSTIDSDSVTNTSRINMVSRPETGALRAEVLGPGQDSGTLIVSNGSTMYMYDRTADRVQRIEIGNLSDADTDSMGSVVEIFEALNEASDDERPTVSVSPLPVVPTQSGGTSVVGTQSLAIYGNVSLSYEGMDTVDGREAYVVQMRPQGQNPLIEENTYWFDEEWYYPLKSVGTVNDTALNGTISMEYQNITFNPEISNETFEFDIPANATVVNNTIATNISAETFDSRESLSTRATRSLPDPEIPDEYQFEVGNLIENGSRESISLRYTNGTESLMVSVRPTTSGGSSNRGETVQIDEHNASITTIRGTHTLTLECGDVTYSVSGSEPRETIIDIAESLDC